MTDFYDTKSAPITALDDTDASGVCVFATMYPAVDAEGDCIMPGAIGNQVVPILPAHNMNSPSIGKAWVFEQNGEARALFKMNQTSAGRDWWEHFQFDASDGRPCQEFSFGFCVKSSAFGQHEGRRVRFLKDLEIFELSPVLKAAGIGTRTVCLGNACKADNGFRVVSVERTLQNVAGFLLKDRLDALTADRCGYKVISAVEDEFFDTSHILAKLAARDLGIEGPKAVRFFRESLPGEKIDLPIRKPIYGLCESGDIFIKVGRSGSDLIATIAHEVFHLTQPEKTLGNSDEIEAEASAYGHSFASKFGTIPGWATLYAHNEKLNEFNPRTTYRDAPKGSYLIASSPTFSTRIEIIFYWGSEREKGL